jgi:hypothetical protein
MALTRGRGPDDGASGEEGFLHRWSRRKGAARVAQTSTEPDLPDIASPAADAAVATTLPTTAPVEDGRDAVVPAAAVPVPPGDDDMPPLETLDQESDVSAFFSPRVSETLRRAALRRIFHQPSFNVTDGLDDYAADYRHLTPLGDIVTSDMRLQLERAEERLLRAADEAHDAGGDAPAARAPEVAALAKDDEVPDGNDD